MTLTGAKDFILDALFTGPAGKSIVTFSADRTVRRYPCDICGASIEDLVSLARRRLTRGFTASERAQYLHQPQPKVRKPTFEATVTATLTKARSFGLLAKSVYPDLAHRLDLSTDYGALVMKVVPRSPAGQAGLQGGQRTIGFQNTRYRIGGDVILSVNGETLVTKLDLRRYIEALRPGDVAHLEILRDGQTRRVDVSVGDRSD